MKSGQRKGFTTLSVLTQPHEASVGEDQSPPRLIYCCFHHFCCTFLKCNSKFGRKKQKLTFNLIMFCHYNVSQISVHVYLITCECIEGLNLPPNLKFIVIIHRKDRGQFDNREYSTKVVFFLAGSSTPGTPELRK